MYLNTKLTYAPLVPSRCYHEEVSLFYPRAKFILFPVPPLHLSLSTQVRHELVDHEPTVLGGIIQRREIQTIL